MDGFDRTGKPGSPATGVHLTSEEEVVCWSGESVVCYSPAKLREETVDQARLLEPFRRRRACRGFLVMPFPILRRNQHNQR